MTVDLCVDPGDALPVRSSAVLRLLFAVTVAGAAGCSPSGEAAGRATPTATRAPLVASPGPPGHELYGFVPYWEMDDGIAAHLRSTPLSTIALFSVTHTAKGAIDTDQQGYRRITGEPGTGIIRDAHDRGTRVEIVYSSFGSDRNARLLARPAVQRTVVESLVGLVRRTGVDGIDVDVETLDPVLVPAYGAFVGHLRDALRAVDPALEVSVATGAGPLGAAMALAAVEAGADRVFLMGYDYRVASSSPGASAPLDRSDGGERSLRWSLDLYAALGVPANRLLLGLPLYGMQWPVAGPVIGAPSTGQGEVWIPRRNVPLLLDASVTPLRDEVEQVDVYLRASDGSTAAPAPGASLTPSQLARTWTATYVDSPGTLAPKVALANERGLAGAGFWAVGYERGLPGYSELMGAFASGAPIP